MSTTLVTKDIEDAAENVQPPRTRYVVIGGIYLFLGIGLAEMIRRIPSEEVTFTFGIGDGVPKITFAPPAVVLILGLLIAAAGVTGLFERRLNQIPVWALGVGTALFLPLVLVLSLAYSTSSKQTNLIPLIVESLRLSTPIALGALAGLWSERSGVVNIGIEGMMLAAAGGGFVSYSLFGATGGFGLWASVLIAISIGGVMAALHALMCVTFRTDQIISGVVINLLALGVTSYLRQQVIIPSGVSNGPTLPSFAIPGLSALPIIGPLFEGQPIYFTMFLLLIGTAYLLFRTPFGLRVRAVGENPHAAETLGVDPIRIRYMSVIIGGLIAGLAGAWFSLETVGSFEDNMTNGAGFIALAALIFGKWKPWGAFGGALLFGFSNALGVRLQILSVTITDFRFWGIKLPDFEVPSQLLQALPYVLTIIVLAGAIGTAKGPAANGIPYERSK